MDHDAIDRAVALYRRYLSQKGVRRFKDVRHSVREALSPESLGWAHILVDGAEEAVRQEDLSCANWLVGFVQGMLWVSGHADIDELARQSVIALGPEPNHPQLELAGCPLFHLIRDECLARLDEDGLRPARHGRDVASPSSQLSMEHAGWMLEEIAALVAAGRLSKACRWLGFAQACFWANGAFSFSEILAYHPFN